jgi:hypothetical protein
MATDGHGFTRIRKGFIYPCPSVANLFLRSRNSVSFLAVSEAEGLTSGVQNLDPSGKSARTTSTGGVRRED